MTAVLVFILVLMFCAAAFLVYTYAGYPWLMSRLARRVPAGTESGAGADISLPPITVIISAYNAAAHLPAKMASCLALDYPAGQLQVLVVSDGSTDNTEQLVQAMAATEPRVRLLSFAARRGKAACLNDAVAATSTPLILFTDARQPFDPAAARLLAAHFADPAVGGVSGALDIAPVVSTNSAEGASVVASAGIYWKLEKKLRADEACLHSAIGATGAIYAMRREAFKPVPVQTILDDVLIPMTAVMNGWRVLFDRHAQAFDVASVSEEQEMRRKVRTLAGNFQLLALRPGLLNPAANPLWWQFASHKIFRVLAPLAMAVFMLANAWLVGAANGWLAVVAGLMLAGQVVVYTVAVLPEGQGRVWQLLPLRILKTLRGFVRLQWFAVLGFIWFLRNPEPQLWQTTQHAASR